MRRVGSRRGRRDVLRGSLALAGLGLLAGCGLPPAGTQQPRRTPRVGILHASAATRQAIGEGLRDLGYVDGQNIVIESRSAEGSLDLLPGLAAELVRLPVDVIVTTGVAATLAARDATRTIPIVQASGNDPVQFGAADGYARPGGNVTGLMVNSPGLFGKRLQLLKEVVPGLGRVAVLWNPANPPTAAAFAEAQGAAQALGLGLQSLEARSPDDLEPLLEAAARERADALLLLGDPLAVTHHPTIAALAATRRLPSMFDRRAFAAAGGLMSYGPDDLDLHRRAAGYVDRILKGASPADLPIEKPTKFDLVINLKAAHALGLAVPASVLVQATEVIE